MLLLRLVRGAYECYGKMRRIAIGWSLMCNVVQLLISDSLLTPEGSLCRRKTGMSGLHLSRPLLISTRRLPDFRLRFVKGDDLGVRGLGRRPGHFDCFQFILLVDHAQPQCMRFQPCSTELDLLVASRTPGHTSPHVSLWRDRLNQHVGNIKDPVVHQPSIETSKNKVRTLTRPRSPRHAMSW